MTEADRLEAAIGECREMLREAHAATKDLRAAGREAKRELQALAKDEVAAQVQHEVSRQLEELGERTHQAISAATQKVIAGRRSPHPRVAGDPGGGVQRLLRAPGRQSERLAGQNADGTLFVGRMPMAQDTGTCCIIAKHEPLQPSIPLTGPRPSNAELERMRQIAATGTLATTIIGEQAGAIGLIDLRMEERVLATLERAPE